VRPGAGGSGRLVVAVAAGALAAAFLPASGAARSAGAPQARANALRAQEDALARRARGTLLQLYALESRLSRARGKLAALDARSAELTRQRDRTRRRATAVRHSLATARAQLGRALRTLYQQGQPDPVAVLLGATSLDQALEGIDGLRRAALTHTRLIADLRRKEARLRTLEARLRVRDRRVAAARRNAQAGVAQLGLSVRARSQTLAALRARHNLTRRQVATLDELARQAQKRSAALATTAAHATVTSPPVTPARRSRPTPWPVAGSTITMVVDAVAYHLPGRTASGLPVGIGVVAVDPTVIPLGTRMFVPGYGPAVAADVGSAVRGRIIDLWMPSRAKALAWGRRTVTITIYG
jgi:3D (Asp-Asp-Asp) domain-containing protein/peptidoglycan hydrolase CwlO-like protein